jgi:hypothetical protein
MNQALPVPGILATVLPSIGKLIHFALTGREQFNGHLPNLDEPALQAYSPHCRLTLELLSQVDARQDRAADARLAVARWGEAVQ